MQLKIPRQKKFKKYHKQFISLKSSVDSSMINRLNGFALISLEPGRISARHFEMIRKAIKRILKRTGKILIPGFPHLPVTSKPLEVRMGKGKGAVDYWCMPVRAGFTLVSLTGVNRAQAVRALEAVRPKLPVRTKITTSFF